jgi:hypothetical protein
MIVPEMQEIIVVESAIIGIEMKRFETFEATECVIDVIQFIIESV